jgi:hypothetical protein
MLNFSVINVSRCDEEVEIDPLNSRDSGWLLLARISWKVLELLHVPN